MKPKDKLQIIKPAVANLPAITPPPRKEDILNAMVERARVKHQEEYDRLEKNKEGAKEKLKNALLELLKVSPSSFSTDIDTWCGCCRVEFTLENLPPHIEKLRKAYKDAPSIRGFDESAVKRKIREGMSAAGGDRVKALLDNPEAVKAMDAALDKM